MRFPFEIEKGSIIECDHLLILRIIKTLAMEEVLGLNIVRVMPGEALMGLPRH
jgi:hypothetical protein